MMMSRSSSPRLNWHIRWPGISIPNFIRFPNSKCIISHLLLADHPLWKIALVPHQCQYDLIHHCSLQLRNPSLNVHERRVIGKVKDEQGGIGTSIIHRSHAPEFLLTRRVPHLHIDTNIVHCYAAAEKGGTNCGCQFLGIRLGDILCDQTGLAHTCRVEWKEEREAI